MHVRLVVGLLVMSSTVAIAQPAPDDVGPPGAPGEPAPPPPPAASMPAPVVAPVPPPQPALDHPGVDRGIVEDAASATSFLAPTALTAPKGTWWFSDVDLFLVTGGYAVTDELSISATTLIPIVKDQPFWGLLNGKLMIAKTGQLRLAAQAALTVVRVPNDTTDSMGNTTTHTDSYFAGDIGGAATYCIDVACHSHASLFVGAGFARSDQSSVPLLVAASVAARINRHVKLVGEIDTGYVVGNLNSTSDAFLVWYGARFTGRSVGVDFGFVKPIVDGDSTGDVLPLGFPYLGFTYRSIDD